LERKFLKMSGFFKAVLVTGARQVGKTTMLRRLAERDARAYVSLDDLMARDLASSDPDLFFQAHKPPILIDEVQHAPQLFGRIKAMCDESDATGRFWLTGSQQFGMMRGVRESLAGRIGVLQMHSLTKHEADGVAFDDDQDFAFATLSARQAAAPKTDAADIFGYIWKGGMPQLAGADDELRNAYYESYVSTYLMRDAAAFGGVSDELRFGRFLVACAALVGEQVSYKTLSDAAGIAQPTAKEWLRLLEGLGVAYLLQPFAHNALKRLAKAPKLYFLDSGLAAYLSRWPTSETLMLGPASGHYFENFVVTELVKCFACSREDARFSYYRDANAKEVDLFVERGGCIHPLEIKRSANPDKRVAKKFELLDKLPLRRGAGGIVCMAPEAVPISASECFIPAGLL